MREQARGTTIKQRTHIVTLIGRDGKRGVMTFDKPINPKTFATEIRRLEDKRLAAKAKKPDRLERLKKAEAQVARHRANAAPQPRLPPWRGTYS